MDNDALQQYVIEISNTVFGKPFKHQAYFNARLRTTGGRYMLASHAIEINPKHYAAFGVAELEKIIKHELCHYHLHLEGRGYQHRDQDFKMLSKKVGAPRYCQSTETYQSRVNHVYVCQACGMRYERIRKVNTKRMACGQCGGKLKEQ